MPFPLPTADQSASELKRQVELDREGDPFLVYRDPGGAQVAVSLAGRERLAVGRGDDVDVRLDGDDAVSRLHAELVRAGGSWVVVDDGLSTNGTFVNGKRITTRRRLADRDLIRVGGTGILFRDPAVAPDPPPTAAAGDEPPPLGEVQRKVLVALCRPLAEGHSFAATPASNRAIADELFLSVGAVKAHMRALFEKFAVAGLPQNRKRAALADRALRSGAIHPGELAPRPSEAPEP